MGFLGCEGLQPASSLDRRRKGERFPLSINYHKQCAISTENCFKLNCSITIQKATNADKARLAAPIVVLFCTLSLPSQQSEWSDTWRRYFTLAVWAKPIFLRVRVVSWELLVIFNGLLKEQTKRNCVFIVSLCFIFIFSASFHSFLLYLSNTV